MVSGFPPRPPAPPAPSPFLPPTPLYCWLRSFTLCALRPGRSPPRQGRPAHDLRAAVQRSVHGGDRVEGDVLNLALEVRGAAEGPGALCVRRENVSIAEVQDVARVLELLLRRNLDDVEPVPLQELRKLDLGPSYLAVLAVFPPHELGHQPSSRSLRPYDVLK